jgi:phosphoglycolate phosphatase
MMTSRNAAKLPHWRGRTLGAILLDLDGTLLDTAADIAVALNQALAEKQLMPLSIRDVRDLIGRGAPMLIARALERLGLRVDAAEEAALIERFYFHYDQLHVLDESTARAYPGVSEGIGKLHALGLRLAVVTNKQRHFAMGLLKRLALSQWIDVVVGGDSCERRKPDPQPLIFACQSLQVEPQHTLMVGDSLNDVLAARAAGLPVLCVPYGYNEGCDPRALPCDAVIESLSDLPAILLAAVPASNSPS